MTSLVQGRTYNITCKNFSAYMYAPPQVEYSGVVIKSEKQDPPDTIRLTTGIDFFPYRLIRLESILKVDGDKVSFSASKPSVRVVQGSRGDQYVVTTVNGRTSCTCPGFQFRRKCKHCEE